MKAVSRALPKALRPVARQVAGTALKPAQRTFVTSVLGSKRAALSAVPQCAPLVHFRGIKTMDFAGSKETVYGMPKSLQVQGN